MTDLVQLNNDIIKIARGLGQTIEMYKESGEGPIVDTEEAKYLYLVPLHVMIAIPKDEKSDDIFLYIGKEKDQFHFNTLIFRIRNLVHFHGMGLSIKNFNVKKVHPKHFSDEAKAAKARSLKEK